MKWRTKGAVSGRGKAPENAPPPARKLIEYGGNGTIHHTGTVDVELDSAGDVCAVWYRCHMLPFTQTVVDRRRAHDMTGAYDKDGGRWATLPIHSITFEQEGE